MGGPVVIATIAIVLAVAVALIAVGIVGLAILDSHVTDTADYEDEDDAPLTTWFDCVPEPAREPGRHRLVVPTIGERRRAEWDRESGGWQTLLAAHAAESYAGRDYLRRNHDIVPPTEAARMLAEAVA